jgi:MscS family membrane protein
MMGAQTQILPNDTTEAPQEDSAPEWPEDSLGRRTPRATVAGFIEAVADENYVRASQYLNLKPSFQGEQ